MSRWIISPAFLLIFFSALFVAHVASSVVWGSDAPYVNIISAIFHFSGGFWLAAAVIYFLLKRSGLFESVEKRWIGVFVIVSIVVFLGVGWEVFEFVLDKYFIIPGISPYQKMQLQDTIADLVFDTIGAFTAASFYFFSKKQFVSGN